MIVDFWHYEHEGFKLMVGVDVKISDPKLWEIVSAEQATVSDEETCDARYRFFVILAAYQLLKSSIDRYLLE